MSRAATNHHPRKANHREPLRKGFAGFLRHKLRRLKGFTVLELLVTIAIVIVLLSVLFASLSVARGRSRDARRISDIREIQKALELFFDAHKTYPPALDNIVSEGLLRVGSAAKPKEPRGGDYYYLRCSSTRYHLGADLEGKNNSALNSDLNDSPCPGSDFFGKPLPGASNDDAKCMKDGGDMVRFTTYSGYCYDVSN